MELLFVPMSRDYAAEIVGWRYEVPYDVYGFEPGEQSEVVDYMVDSENPFFALLLDRELIGFRSFGTDGRVAGGDYDDEYLDTGGGLRPDLTGKGMGAEVVQKGLEFGRHTFGTLRFRTTVADFNQRAKKVCTKIGFERIAGFSRTSDGEPFSIFVIEITKAV